MKILYHHRVAAGDGQRVHITEMIAAFERLGHQVILVDPRVAVRDYSGTSGLVSVIRRLLPAFMGESLEIIYSLRAYFKLRKTIKKERPDALYERANLFLMAGLSAARWAGIPLILEVNAPLAEERAKHGVLHLKSIARWMEKRVWRGADICVPVSAVLGQHLIEAGVAKAAVHPLHNGINLSDYPAPKTKPSSKRIRIGFIGFVRSWHKLDLIIGLLHHADFTHVDLEIAGDGPALPALKQEAERLGLLDRVHFPGLIAREAVPALLASWDIALQPGVTDYASPLKLFEYMAAGLAVIAPDQPNIKEVLTDQVNASLFQGVASGMEKALGTLVQDAGLRQSLGNQARQDVINTPYTWDGNARRVIDLITAIKD